MIYSAYQSQLRRYAQSLCHDAHWANDLVQYAFLRVCEHAEALEGYVPARVQGWLMLTLRNAWIDEVRKRRREQLRSALPERGEDADFSGPQVQAALRLLPESLRQTVLLRHFYGLNATEIGERMGIPPATVRTRLRTAAKLLRVAYLEK